MEWEIGWKEMEIREEKWRNTERKEKNRRSNSKEWKPEKEISWLDEENWESQDEKSKSPSRYSVEELWNENRSIPSGGRSADRAAMHASCS
jgi:hypothetical protein